MKVLDRIALVLVIIGALNWGAVGLFRFDWGAAESFEGVVHDALSHYRL